MYQGGAACLMGLDPAKRTEAPEVAFFESGELIFRHGGNQIVALITGVFQKGCGHACTDRMLAPVSGAGAAVTVPKITGHRFSGAGL